MKLGAMLVALTAVVIFSLFSWSSYFEVYLSAAVGEDPVTDCTGKPDGTACVLKPGSGGSVTAQAIALGDVTLGVCKDGKCVPNSPSPFACPSGTALCSKGGKSICCPSSGFSCIRITNPFDSSSPIIPYCNPDDKKFCPAGTTYCNPGWGGTEICCPTGTTCDSYWGVALCRQQNNGLCATGTPCGSFLCCNANQQCIRNPLDPNDGNANVCSSTNSRACTSPKTLCSHTLPGYPHICCNPGKCIVDSSGYASCTDGDPGFY